MRVNSLRALSFFNSVNLYGNLVDLDACGLGNNVVNLMNNALSNCVYIHSVGYDYMKLNGNVVGIAANDDTLAEAFFFGDKVEEMLLTAAWNHTDNSEAGSDGLAYKLLKIIFGKRNFAYSGFVRNHCKVLRNLFFNFILIGRKENIIAGYLADIFNFVRIKDNGASVKKGDYGHRGKE